MANYQYMMSADDVARELNCSKSHVNITVRQSRQSGVARATCPD